MLGSEVCLKHNYFACQSIIRKICMAAFEAFKNIDVLSEEKKEDSSISKSFRTPNLICEKNE